MAKPVSGSALDTNSTYYDSLSNAWGFLEGSGTFSVDSRTRLNATFSHTDISWTTNASEAVISSTNTANHAWIDLNQTVSLEAGVSWTIAFNMHLNEFLSDGVLLANSAEDSYVAMMAGGSPHIRVYSTTGRLYTFTNFAYTVASNYAIVYDSTIEQMLFYKDGAVSSGVDVLSPSESGLELNRMIGDSSALVGQTLEGVLRYMYIWPGRALDSSLVADLHTDPYRIYSSTARMLSRTPTASRANLQHILGR